MEEKFKLNTFIGQKVYHIEINIRDDKSKRNSTSLDKEGIFIKEFTIVHQTRRKTAISNEWISTFDRQKIGEKKESYNSYLNDPTVRIKTKETYFANGIFSTMYSLEDPKKAIKKIKKAIIEKINSEYGFLRFADIENIINSFEIKTN